MKRNLILLLLAFGLSMTFSCKKDQGIIQKEVQLTSKEISDVDKYAKQIFIELENVSKNGDLAAFYHSKEAEISKALNPKTLSNNYSKYLVSIQGSSNFSSAVSYLNHLNKTLNEAKSDASLSNEELKSIIIIAKTLENFVKYGDSFQNSRNYADFKATTKSAAKEEESWWDSWGKCAAGIIGGAGLGGLGGAAVTSPTVVGVPVGVAVGVIAGGLSGAAASC